MAKTGLKLSEREEIVSTLTPVVERLEQKLGYRPSTMFQAYLNARKDTVISNDVGEGTPNAAT